MSQPLDFDTKPFRELWDLNWGRQEGRPGEMGLSLRSCWTVIELLVQVYRLWRGGQCSMKTLFCDLSLGGVQTASVGYDSDTADSSAWKIRKGSGSSHL